MELVGAFSLPVGLKQCSNKEDFQNVKMEATKLLKCHVGGPIVFLSPHFIGQSKSQGQPTFKRKKNQTHPLMREMVRSHFRRYAKQKLLV